MNRSLKACRRFNLLPPRGHTVGSNLFLFHSLSGVQRFRIDSSQTKVVMHARPCIKLGEKEPFFATRLFSQPSSWQYVRGSIASSLAATSAAADRPHSLHIICRDDLPSTLFCERTTSPSPLPPQPSSPPHHTSTRMTKPCAFLPRFWDVPARLKGRSVGRPRNLLRYPLPSFPSSLRSSHFFHPSIHLSVPLSVNL